MKRSDFFPIDAPLWSMYCRDYEYLHGKTVYLNRFIARYSLAKAFKGIDAQTYRRSTLMGYDAVMRLMLVFSAYDTLFVAMEKLTPHISLTYDIDSYPIYDSELEHAFRSNLKLMKMLKADARHGSLQRLLDFEAGSQSITSIAYGIRNMVAHGQMNPTASEANKAVVAQQINQLAFLLLDACDFIFKDYLTLLKNVLEDSIKVDYVFIENESKELAAKHRIEKQIKAREVKKHSRKNTVDLI
jgi:hypothetical protein